MGMGHRICTVQYSIVAQCRGHSAHGIEYCTPRFTREELKEETILVNGYINHLQILQQTWIS